MAKTWTADEDDLIREMYGKITNKDLAERIGDCIPLQVFRRAIKLGLETEPAKTAKNGAPAAGKRGPKKGKPAGRKQVLVEAEGESGAVEADEGDGRTGGGGG